MSQREYIARRLVDPSGNKTVWGHSIIKAYTAVARLTLLPSFGIYRPSEWLVLGARIFNQLDAKLQSKTHLVLTARDPIRCNSWPSSWSYDLKAYAELKALIQDNDELSYAVCRRRIDNVLRRTQAKLIIVNSTIDPINRIWLQTAKDAGLKTICVQHGVYSRVVPHYVLEENIVDKYVALDSGQAAIINRNIPLEKIAILGQRDSFEWFPPDRPLKICLVGEDWERYEVGELKRSVICTWKDIIISPEAKAWGAFYYKLHPSEQMLLDILDYASPLKVKDINLPDVYIGYASTFLKEMCSKGKLVIQIFDTRTHAENFEKLGYCLSLPNDDRLVEALDDLLSSRLQVPFIKNAELSQILLNHE